MTRHAKLIRDFYIYSLDEFDKVSERAIELCDENNARAYFRLNLRDSKKIALQYNKRLSELLITEDYKAIPRAYASVVGEFHSDPEKKWLIDLDKPKDYTENGWGFYKSRAVWQLEDLGGKVIAKIPTKNGLHLITTPFRLDVFKQQCPYAEVHKDNPTILYVP